MPIDTRWQQHLMATLREGTLPRSERSDGSVGIVRGLSNGHTGTHDPLERHVDHKSRLSALLENLGVGNDIFNAPEKRDAAAVAHAATVIAEWLTYLPADCVRAMVRDGWHWST
jgi:hypothetical protein